LDESGGSGAILKVMAAGVAISRTCDRHNFEMDGKASLWRMRHGIFSKSHESRGFRSGEQ